METIDSLKITCSDVLQSTINLLHEIQVKLSEVHGDLEDAGLNHLSDLSRVLDRLINYEKMRLINVLMRSERL